MAYIEVQQATRQFKNGEQVTVANRDISFEVDQGAVVVILGPSGAGKSTLLNILGGMDSPTSGRVLVDGVDIAQFNSRQLTTYRRQAVGFVFQFYNLVPNLTARENVELASQITKDARDVDETLALVGLTHRQITFQPSCPVVNNSGSQLRGQLRRIPNYYSVMNHWRARLSDGEASLTGDSRCG
ncbi:hypothetical protein O209_11650 [Lactiplantibacillus plantarum WHE 92]|nr:hypothetical protein O209_11650 [Lactiplantibacillus plantarum WHE 92]